MRREGNQVPGMIHQMADPYKGENHWFGGAARYVMEGYGEKEYNYDFFAGLSGDLFAQFYAYDNAFLGDSVIDYKLSDMDYAYAENVFRACGYEALFVPEVDLRANRDMYLEMAMEYIDRGIPGSCIKIADRKRKI